MWDRSKCDTLKEPANSFLLTGSLMEDASNIARGSIRYFSGPMATTAYSFPGTVTAFTIWMCHGFSNRAQHFINIVLSSTPTNRASDISISIALVTDRFYDIPFICSRSILVSVGVINCRFCGWYINFPIISPGHENNSNDNDDNENLFHNCTSLFK